MNALWIKIIAGAVAALVVVVSVTVVVVRSGDDAPKKDAFTEQWRKTPIQNTGRDKGY